MEACCGAHHLDRVFASLGHDVRFMSPEHFRLYVKTHKNDDRDAEGIAKAATRPTMRSVELKSQDQRDIQTLHRARDRLVARGQRRSIRSERSCLSVECYGTGQAVPGPVDEQDGAGLSPCMICSWPTPGRTEPRSIAGSQPSTPSSSYGRRTAKAHRPTKIPGVGAIVASALVAAIGRAKSFDHGRDLAAWLGLVPHQFTTGGKPKLLGISKRGNKYLRKQLIHGACAVLPRWLSATRRAE
jgi:transposase